ncbi:MAG TPA: AAA family ATPase [Candidatus Dormibacteraeota bacterium]
MVHSNACPTVPFVGRARELAVGRQVVNRAARGSGGLILVSGEPGIGKSRLASELATLVPGWQVLTGSARSEDADRAYGPLQEAFDRAGEGGHRAPWARAQARAGTLAGVLTSLRLPGDHERAPLQNQPLVFDGLLDAMLGEDRATPTLLVLEDLHWADEGSWDFVAHTARRLPDLPLVVLVTHRDDRLVVHRSGLERVLAMSEQDHVHRLGLTGLSSGETAVLAGAVAPRLPPAMLDEAVELSEGTPLLLIELVGDLMSEAPRRHRMPDRTAELLSRFGERLSRLRPEVRELLELAAVVGAQSSAWSVLSLGPALDLLEEAAELGWVHLSSSEPLRYEFTHHLRREALERGLKASRRRQLHAQVARAMERLEPDRLERLSFHWEAAGEPELAVEVLVTGIEDARRTGNTGRAASLGLTAWELVRRQPALHQRTVPTCQALLDDLVACGRWTEMERVVRQRWDGRRRLEAGEAERLAHHLVTSLIAQARFDEARAVAGQETDLSRVSDGLDSTPDLPAGAAWLAEMTGMPPRAAREKPPDLVPHGGMAVDPQSLERAERDARRRGGWTVVPARLAQACVHTLRGEAGHAGRIYAQLQKDVPTGAPFLAHHVDAGEADLLLHLGRLREADELLRREPAGLQIPPGLVAASTRGWLAWERGELERAAAELRLAREGGSRTGCGMLELGPIRLPLEVDSLIRLGRCGEAVPAIDAAAGHRDLNPFLRAALAAARFRAEPGPERAEEAVRAAVAAPFPWMEGQVRCWRAELLHERDQADLACRVFSEVGARAGAKRAMTLAHHQGRPGGAAADGGLTPRQLELAGLVAAHLTNREIADRLSLSEHTVARHLHNIYATLGFKKRSELAEWAGSQKIHRSVYGRQVFDRATLILEWRVGSAAREGEAARR